MPGLSGLRKPTVARKTLQAPVSAPRPTATANGKKARTRPSGLGLLAADSEEDGPAA